MRTRLNADIGDGKKIAREFNGIIDCCRKIHNSDGLYGFYRGYGVTIGGIVAYRAMYFGLFDTGKVLLFQDARRANMAAMWVFA